jgi:hypothetical protein
MAITRKGARLAVLTAGVVALVGFGGAAWADPVDDVVNGEGVGTELKLHVAGCEDGDLYLTVDDTDVPMTEVTSGVTGQRWFTGEMNDVTVTDTRCEEDIDPGAFWWVEGTASDFAAQAPLGSSDDISVDHLGWQPFWGSAPDTTNNVDVGDQVYSVIETGQSPDDRGLSGREYMYSVQGDSNNPDVVEQDSWTARAYMNLRLDYDPAPGDYISLLTLTLFE